MKYSQPRTKMRRIVQAILTLVLFLFWLTSFSQKNEKANYIILSGKIENVATQTNGKKTIKLIPPFYLKSVKDKVVHLADDGSFTDTVKTGKGLYHIFDQTNLVPIYLDTSKTYTITYNSANYRKGVVNLSGADTTINRYFIEKGQKRIFVDRLNLHRSEEDFREFIGKIKHGQLQRLAESQLPLDVKEEEAKNIKYEWLSELYFFLVSKQDSYPDFTPSLISRNELNIDYNNEEEYKRQPSYVRLVSIFYDEKLSYANKKNKEKDAAYSKSQHIIRLIDSLVTNQYIKNDFIRQYAESELTSAENKEAYYNDFVKYYTGDDEELKQSMYDAYLRFTRLKKGIPSPEFFNYPDYKGGSKSLKDFKGRFVYIDIWATWCGNCWHELPYLKKMEEKYANKNIVFLSLSWDRFENDWKDAIQKYSLSGVQLLANSQDDFFKSYAVSGIPRYILLDTNGCIIDYNAPRPSEKEKLQELFKSVGL